MDDLTKRLIQSPEPRVNIICERCAKHVESVEIEHCAVLFRRLAIVKCHGEEAVLTEANIREGMAFGGNDL